MNATRAADVWHADDPDNLTQGVLRREALRREWPELASSLDQEMPSDVLELAGEYTVNETPFVPKHTLDDLVRERDDAPVPSSDTPAPVHKHINIYLPHPATMAASALVGTVLGVSATVAMSGGF